MELMISFHPRSGNSKSYALFIIALSTVTHVECPEELEASRKVTFF